MKRVGVIPIGDNNRGIEARRRGQGMDGRRGKLTSSICRQRATAPGGAAACSGVTSASCASLKSRQNIIAPKAIGNKLASRRARVRNEKYRRRDGGSGSANAHCERAYQRGGKKV
jgi:hypothetical protein